MAGQLIKLDGVRSSGIPGQARIDMDSADLVAASLPSLVHSFNPRVATVNSDGSIRIADRTDGRVLACPAFSELSLSVSDPDFNGQTVIQADDDGSGAWGLSFAPGKVSDSYTIVGVASVNSDLVTRPSSGTLNCTLLSSLNPLLDDDQPLKNNTRYRLPSAPSPASEGLVIWPDNHNNSGATVNVGYEKFSADDPFIFVETFDFNTKTISAYFNGLDLQGAAVASGVTPLTANEKLQAYWNLGGAAADLSTGSFVGKIGDFYIFNEALDVSAATLYQLRRLVEALKTKYGI
ncbi:hypothetical protein [Salinicola sp. CPA57]|uniref:hypothetical protein n=1 Tax=Salinicola sp. CPA57 TaxID=1949080 RepID=UPI0013007EDC|nr:hypothetical protein [Salinicola sp. CPA57]